MPNLRPPAEQGESRPFLRTSVMRILIHSHFFHPSIGGCETFTDLLASGLSERGFAIRVVTETPLAAAAELDRPYGIVRSKRWAELEALSDVGLLVAVGPSIRFLP